MITTKKSKKYGKLDHMDLHYGVVEEYSGSATPSLIARFADDEEAKPLRYITRVI